MSKTERRKLKRQRRAAERAGQGGPTATNEISPESSVIEAEVDDLFDEVSAIGSIGVYDDPVSDGPGQYKAPVPERPKRAFRDRLQVLDDGVDVRILNADGALEEDVYIETSSNRLLVLTGEAARRAKGGEVSSGPLHLRETEEAPRHSAEKSNEDTFVSSSRVRHAPIVYPELAKKPDRTLPQRRMLRGGMTVATGAGEVEVDTGLELSTAGAGV